MRSATEATLVVAAVACAHHFRISSPGTHCGRRSGGAGRGLVKWAR